MPRCFMAKKLKYPYKQWKDAQENGRSSSPSSAVVKTEEDPDEIAYPETPVGPLHDNDRDFRPTSEYSVPSSAHTVYSSEPRGSALITPPPETPNGKKDLFRPYCLQDPILAKYERPAFDTFFPYTDTHLPSTLQYRNIEDINTAHAILDLSSSARAPPDVPLTPLLSPASSTGGNEGVKSEYNGDGGQVFKVNNGKTTAYTYEAFFASDGRSRKKQTVESGREGGGGVGAQNKPRYSCSECGKHYATSSNLSRHKQTHRSLDSNNAKKCHVCGKLYVSMPALSMHILTHNLSHKCTVCGKAFSRPWLLQGHMRSHSGDKPYGCAHCGKSFADRSNLRAHMQTHSAFKNFKCKRCNKSFALKSYLNKHYESACFKDQQHLSHSEGSSSPPPSPSSSVSSIPFSPPHQEEERPLLTQLNPPPQVHHLQAPLVNPPQHHLLRV